MKRYILFLFLIFNILSVAFVNFSVFSQTETSSITTYYPAPYGEYLTLRLLPRAPAPASECDSSDEEGTIYYDSANNQIKICQKTGTMPDVFTWQSSGGETFWKIAGVVPNQYIYASNTNYNVGIGTTIPKNKLDVAGPMVIGVSSGYAGTTIPVGTDLLVEGTMGIGTAPSAAKLTVAGKVRINDAYTLPDTDGASGQMLVTDGSGTLSWQTPMIPDKVIGAGYECPPSTVGCPAAGTSCSLSSTCIMPPAPCTNDCCCCAVEWGATGDIACNKVTGKLSCGAGANPKLVGPPGSLPNNKEWKICIF